MKKILKLLFILFGVASWWPKRKNNIIIEVDVNPYNIKNDSGPFEFIKGINQTLPYNIKNCSFIASNNIKLSRKKFPPHYYYLFYPQFKENIFINLVNDKISNKLILGPIFIPEKWFLFPQKIVWKENKLTELLKLVKGIVVHSDRVKNHIVERSNTKSMIKKFINVRACTNLKPKNVKNFNERTYDILFFEKYQDLNRTKQGDELFKLLKSSQKKIVRIQYGNYTKKQMIELANDTKYIIYFSFYDTGAIGLKEIQNFGVIAFVLQEDFIFDNRTCFYISELNDENNIITAYEKIVRKIEMISKYNPNTKLIAEINQENHNCKRALDDLCNGLQ